MMYIRNCAIMNHVIKRFLCILYTVDYTGLSGNPSQTACVPYFFITKTYLYNFDFLKPQFYIVKLGFTGVYIIFLISAQKHRLWVLFRSASARQF